MPTFNPPECWLRQAIESVRSQLYPDWELCIADDASHQPHVRAILEEYQRLDERIKIVFRGRNGHISAASNSALELATGKFVALLDHDDELPEHALYMVALAIEDAPELNLIYSDEDKIDERGRRFGPYFKPDWNPDLLNAQNMISHLGVYRTEVIKSIGGFRSGVEGSQDWDLALRVVEQIPPATIRHIPDVLYHWRAISGSTALGHEEKSYVASASQRVVREHLQRISQSASVEPAFSSFVRIRYPVPTPAPLVSVILRGDLINSEELIHRTHYPALEIIPCPPCNDATQADAMNKAAKQARGELLCFLDAGLLPETEDWLEELAGQARRPEIGAVGPMQLDAAGNIQAALTVLCGSSGGNRVSWSFYQSLHPQEKGVAGRAALQQNVTVLAKGCLILRTENFHAVNGFDAENFPNQLFELDLCLRLVEAGYRNAWTPYARMVSRSALTTFIGAGSQHEAARFRKQWRDYVNHDPAHNPNLACSGEWPFPAYPPRVDRPWRSGVKQ
ncbi:MAG: glycosyltransferase [Polaromonas sp.]|nr:glycosyltransferase [Polaromonas sp.]